MDEIKINMIEKTDEGLVLKLPTTSVEQVKGLKESLDKKVDKVEGKQLSTNDYSTEEKNKLSKLNNYDDTNIKADIAKKADTSTVNTNLAKKVDKVSGKGLSTNDYTDLEKTEVAKIKNLATNETVTEIKSDVENLKISKIDKEVGKGLSTNDYDNTEKAEVAKIKNKADKTYVDTELADKATVTDLTKKIDKTSITSDLAGTDETKVLSQKAGSLLEDSIKNIDLSGKIDKSSITDDFNGTDIAKVLSQKGANNLSKSIEISKISYSNGFATLTKISFKSINKSLCFFVSESAEFKGYTDKIPVGFRPKERVVLSVMAYEDERKLNLHYQLYFKTNGEIGNLEEKDPNMNWYPYSIVYECE